MDAKPEVRLDLLPAWTAFIELHNRRQFGMDVNPLAVPAITSYLDVNGYADQEVRLMLYQYVTFLDDTWLKMYMADSKRKQKTKRKDKR